MCFLVAQKLRSPLMHAAGTPMSHRHILRIELTSPAKERLDASAEFYGMKQVAMMSRLVDWFAGQDELMQSAVLGRVWSEQKPDTARMVLERMARGG
jgi:hypothetical protein